MPETNDFINKLLSRNNDELDGILSYAENKKSGNHISNIKREDADAILKEFDTQKNITKIDSLNKNSNEPLNLNSDAQKKVSHTPDIRKITISDSGSKKIISHIHLKIKSLHQIHTLKIKFYIHLMQKKLTLQILITKKMHLKFQMLKYLLLYN